MGILGKLLLVVNLFAGAGFVYLAVQDWSRRQTAVAAVVRSRLVLQGLPLDGTDVPADEEDPEIPFRVETSGGQFTQTVSKAFLDSYFKEIKGTSRLGGAEVVTSQLGEVRRTRQRVQAVLAAADGDKARAAAAAAFLADQSETLDERTAVARLRAADNATELTALLLAKFDATEPSPGKDETERRLKVAHLLVYLDPDPVWQRRAAAAIGVRRYAVALNAQAGRLDRLFGQVQRQVEQDQKAYSTAVDALWRQATDRTLEQMDSRRREAALAGQLAQNREFVNRIDAEVKQLKDKFAQVKAQVDDLLAKQAEAEGKLFEVQRTVGSILGDLFRMEGELAKRERERK